MIIDVDHRQLSTLSDDIENFKNEVVRNTGSLIDSVDSTIYSWSGDDKMAFMAKWDHMRDSGSNYKNMVDSLTNYSGALKEASNKYKDAQIDAVNSANWI